MCFIAHTCHVGWCLSSERGKNENAKERMGEKNNKLLTRKENTIVYDVQIHSTNQTTTNFTARMTSICCVKNNLQWRHKKWKWYTKSMGGKACTFGGFGRCVGVFVYLCVCASQCDRWQNKIWRKERMDENRHTMLVENVGQKFLISNFQLHRHFNAFHLYCCAWYVSLVNESASFFCGYCCCCCSCCCLSVVIDRVSTLQKCVFIFVSPLERIRFIVERIFGFGSLCVRI